MRLRDDFWWDAGNKRAVLLGAIPDPREQPEVNYDPLYLRSLNEDAFEPAMPGDVWECFANPERPGSRAWRRSEDRKNWVLIGYGLWCPNEKCLYGVHIWDHASDCKATGGEPCKVPRPEGEVQSCWAWSGSIEDGTLTAHPSLFVDHESCGWHGWLQNGEMSGTVEAKYQ